MEFTPSRNTVISTAPTENFTMAVNAKSFSILTSGIYKNKVKAVIREYSTNALDAHIEAKNPDPFEVHLPTYEECYFYIRDYGTGLDEEQFINVFFKFFESTKNSSNEFNGVMGLGAKSFFSINTKSFTVESWKDGYHYIYSCFIGQSGIPEYSQLLKEYSQEPEGLKIQASIDQKDIKEFEKNALEVYKYFERQPKFIGKQLELENAYKDSNGLYSIRGDSGYYNNGSYAIMGNVAYPIEHHHGLDKYSNIINSNLLLFFDIGDLTFTPSRESLEYTDYTIKNLKLKFDEVLKHVNDEIVGKINNASSEWEAVKLFNSLYYAYKATFKGLEVPSKLNWKGKFLETKSVGISAFKFDLNKKAKKIVDKITVGDYNYVINDLKVGSITRCSALREKTGNITYLLEQNQVDSITLQHNSKDFILASTLPQPTRNVNQRSALSSFSQMGSNYFVTACWTNVDIKNATSKYYVVRNGYQAMYNGEKTKPERVYKYAKAAGINDFIYGVSQSQEKEIIKLGFVNIYNAIIDKKKDLKKYINDNLPLINELQSYSDFLYKNRVAIDNIKKVAKKHNIDKSPIYSIIDFENNFDNKTYDKFTSKIRSLEQIGDSIDTKPDSGLTKRYQDLLNNYSLLEDNYYGRISVLHFYHYILGVDSTL